MRRIQKELKEVFETVLMLGRNYIALAMDNQMSFIKFYIWF